MTGEPLGGPGARYYQPLTWIKDPWEAFGNSAPGGFGYQEVTSNNSGGASPTFSQAVLQEVQTTAKFQPGPGSATFRVNATFQAQVLSFTGDASNTHYFAANTNARMVDCVNDTKLVLRENWLLANDPDPNGDFNPAPDLPPPAEDASAYSILSRFMTPMVTTGSGAERVIETSLRSDNEAHWLNMGDTAYRPTTNLSTFSGTLTGNQTLPWSGAYGNGVATGNWLDPSIGALIENSSVQVSDPPLCFRNSEVTQQLRGPPASSYTLKAADFAGGFTPDSVTDMWISMSRMYGQDGKGIMKSVTGFSYFRVAGGPATITMDRTQVWRVQPRSSNPLRGLGSSTIRVPHYPIAETGAHGVGNTKAEATRARLTRTLPSQTPAPYIPSTSTSSSIARNFFDSAAGFITGAASHVKNLLQSSFAQGGLMRAGAGALIRYGPQNMATQAARLALLGMAGNPNRKFRISQVPRDIERGALEPLRIADRGFHAIESIF